MAGLQRSLSLSRRRSLRDITASLLFWSWFDVHPWRVDRRSEDWIEYRLRHWLAFTLPSVLAQREGEFRYWLVCDPAARALTEPLAEVIRDERVEMVYADECSERLRGLPAAERHLLVRLDSDDMYHANVAGNVLARRPQTEFLQFNRGWACDVRSGRVRDWRARSSPFYCHVYGDELRSGAPWIEPNHTTVRRRATELGSGHFLVLLHDRNTSTRIGMGRGDVDGDLRRRVLTAFGLGGRRTLRQLLDCARAPGAWTAEPMPGAVFLAFLARATAARRVLALGPAPPAVPRCELSVGDGGYDLAFVDLGGGDASLLEQAVAALLPSGLLLVDKCHTPAAAAALERVMRRRSADVFPEVEALTRDERGEHAALFGRVIGAAA